MSTVHARRLVAGMKVAEVMTTPVVTVRPDTGFTEIVDRLLTENISGVPVVDPAGHLLGLVTEADIVSKEAYGYRRRRSLGLVSEYLRGHDPQWVRKASGLTAADLMTAAPATAGPDDDLAVAARRMLEGGHKRLPVVDSAGRVVGIVTRHDLLRPFARGDEAILADVQQVLADPLSVPEGHPVRATVEGGVVTLAGDVQWPRDVALVEAMVARVPGVVGVDNRLHALETEPGTAPPPPYR